VSHSSRSIPCRRGTRSSSPDWRSTNGLTAPDDIRDQLMRVAQLLGRAIKEAFNPARVGLIIAGFEVPHLHFHVFGVNGLGDFDFHRVESTTDAALASAAARIRASLGHESL